MQRTQQPDGILKQKLQCVQQKRTQDVRKQMLQSAQQRKNRGGFLN
jgi:hypothetical protein